MDIVEAGRPDRDRRASRGWPVGVAALVVLVAVAYGATRPPPDEPPAAASSTPAAAVTVTVESVPPLETTPPEPEPAPEWLLPPLQQRTGLTIAGTSDALLVLDVDSGRTRTVSLPGDTLGSVEAVAAIDGGWLAFRRAECGDFPCAPSALYAVVGGRPRLVARGHAAHADPDGRTVWVSGYAQSAQDPLSTRRWLERRTFRGVRLGPRTTLEPGEDVLGVTRSGPVVGSDSGTSGIVSLVEAATRERRVVLVAETAIAVAANVVAWASGGCQVGLPEGCTVGVTDVVTARTTTVARTPTYVGSGALDPSGRYLAVMVPESPDGDTVAVYDMRERTALPMGDVSAAPPGVLLAWSPDGRWLVLARETYSGPQMVFEGHVVALWRPGYSVAYLAAKYHGAGGNALAVASGR